MTYASNVGVTAFVVIYFLILRFAVGKLSNTHPSLSIGNVIFFHDQVPKLLFSETSAKYKVITDLKVMDIVKELQFPLDSTEDMFVKEASARMSTEEQTVKICNWQEQLKERSAALTAQFKAIEII